MRRVRPGNEINENGEWFFLRERESLIGPEYMSRAGPVSRAVSVCRDDFQAGIT